MKVTSSAVLVLILLIWFNTASGFGNKECVSSMTYNVIVSLIRGCFNIPVAARTNQHRSAIVRFWRNRDKFQLDGETLLFDGKKVARDGDLATFVNMALTSTKGSGARKLNIRLQSSTVGVSRAKIQRVLDRSEMYQLLKARFTNIANLRPIRAKRIHDRHQVDLIGQFNTMVKRSDTSYRLLMCSADHYQAKNRRW